MTLASFSNFVRLAFLLFSLAICLNAKVSAQDKFKLTPFFEEQLDLDYLTQNVLIVCHSLDLDYRHQCQKKYYSGKFLRVIPLVAAHQCVSLNGMNAHVSLASTHIMADEYSIPYLRELNKGKPKVKWTDAEREERRLRMSYRGYLLSYYFPPFSGLAKEWWKPSFSKSFRECVDYAENEIRIALARHSMMEPEGGYAKRILELEPTTTSTKSP